MAQVGCILVPALLRLQGTRGRGLGGRLQVVQGGKQGDQQGGKLDLLGGMLDLPGGRLDRSGILGLVLGQILGLLGTRGSGNLVLEHYGDGGAPCPGTQYR